MRKVLEVLAVERREYRNKKTGAPGVLVLAQCVVREEGGRVLVGEALLPKELEDTKPGVYDAVFELVVDFDRRIASKLVSLNSVARVAVAPKAA